MTKKFTKIQLRRDTTAALSNIILTSGEPAFALDTRVLKIGDGVTAWNSLDGVASEGGGGGLTQNQVLAIVNSGISGVIGGAPELLDTLNELAAAINDDKNFYITLSTISGVASYASGQAVTNANDIAYVSGNALFNVVEDTTPQLGGNLDINSNNIIGTGNINISGSVTAISGIINELSFNTSLADPTLTQGQLAWNSTEGTVDLGFTNTYTQHLGEELHYRVRNVTASTLLKGTAVYASGLTPGGNNRIEVAPFTADGSVREVRFMGLVTENISSSVNGYTTHFGYIRGIDTRGDAATNGTTNKLWATGEPSWSEGDILYAHPTVAGKLTKIEPKHSISVAIILNRHQTEGKLFVRPTSFGHLEDDHDVSISGVVHNDVLVYNSGTSLWENNSKVVFSDTTGIAGASGVNNIVKISQGDFDALGGSVDANTIYFIV